MKTIQTEKYLILVDEAIQPVNGYYYDTFINKIRNTNSAEYGKSEITLQIIAASPKLGNLPEFQTLPPNTEDDVEKLATKYAKLKLGADYKTNIYPDSHAFTYGTFAEEDYKAGYKQAKSETMFSLEDMKKCFYNGGNMKDESEWVFYIQSLTKPKEYEFIPEIEFIEDDDDYFNDEETGRSNQQPKIINNKIQGTWKLKTN